MLIFASLLHASAALPLALHPSQSHSELFCTALNDRASHISCQAAAAPVALSAPDNSDVSAAATAPRLPLDRPDAPSCTFPLWLRAFTPAIWPQRHSFGGPGLGPHGWPANLRGRVPQRSTNNDGRNMRPIRGFPHGDGQHCADAISTYFAPTRPPCLPHLRHHHHHHSRLLEPAPVLRSRRLGVRDRVASSGLDRR